MFEATDSASCRLWCSACLTVEFDFRHKAGSPFRGSVRRIQTLSVPMSHCRFEDATSHCLSGRVQLFPDDERHTVLPFPPPFSSCVLTDASDFRSEIALSRTVIRNNSHIGTRGDGFLAIDVEAEIVDT